MQCDSKTQMMKKNYFKMASAIIKVIQKYEIKSILQSIFKQNYNNTSSFIHISIFMIIIYTMNNLKVKLAIINAFNTNFIKFKCISITNFYVFF